MHTRWVTPPGEIHTDSKEEPATKNYKIQNYKNTKIQKHKNTKIQKYKNTKYKNTKVQK